MAFFLCNTKVNDFVNLMIKIDLSDFVDIVSQAYHVFIPMDIAGILFLSCLSVCLFICLLSTITFET